MVTSMTLLVCGSRVGFTPTQVINMLDAWSKDHPIHTLIHGGARGVDSFAGAWARELGIHEKVYRPDYGLWNREAPLIRNRIMVDRADEMIAFWNRVSRGTKYTIDYAKQQGLNHQVITPEVFNDSKAPSLA